MKNNQASLMLLALLLTACGVNDESIDENSSVVVPDLRLISIGENSEVDNLGVVSEDTDKCSQYSDLGVFGIPLGVACHTTPLVSQIFYGEAAHNSESELSCDAYQEDAENGVLLPLFCSPDLTPYERIQSLRFKDDQDAEIAMSFVDYDDSDNMDAVGSWTPAGDRSSQFPSNLRIWGKSSDTQDDIGGLLATELSDLNTGKVYFNLSSMGEDFAGQVSFQNQEDTSLCASSMSKEHCHYQEIFIQGLADAEDPLAGMDIRIWADAKSSPDHFAIEGSLRLDSVIAQAFWSADEISQSFPSILEVREIYFRTVKHGSNLWGSFDFKDADGQTVDLSIEVQNGISIDFASILKDGNSGEDYAGVCQLLGSEEQVDCQSIDYLAYTGLWYGDEAINGSLDEYQIPVDMTSLPEDYGVVLAD